MLILSSENISFLWRNAALSAILWNGLDIQVNTVSVDTNVFAEGENNVGKIVNSAVVGRDEEDGLGDLFPFFSMGNHLGPDWPEPEEQAEHAVGG